MFKKLRFHGHALIIETMKNLRDRIFFFVSLRLSGKIKKQVFIQNRAFRKYYFCRFIF